MRGGDVHRDAHPRVRHHVFRQLQRLPVGMQRLVGAPRPGLPGGHADHVAVGPVQRLRDVDHARIVQELHKVGVAVESVVDMPVDEAVAFPRQTAVEALGIRLQAVHVRPQRGGLLRVEHRRQVDVPILLNGVHLAGQVRLCYQW